MRQRVCEGEYTDDIKACCVQMASIFDVALDKVAPVICVLLTKLCKFEAKNLRLPTSSTFILWLER